LSAGLKFGRPGHFGSARRVWRSAPRPGRD